MWVTQHFSVPGSPLSHDQQWVSDNSTILSQKFHHISFNDQQTVSDKASFMCLEVSSIMSHWLTESEWQSFSSLPGSFINCVSSPWQEVSDRAWFLWDGSFINSSSGSVTAQFLHMNFIMSCISWPTESEWHSFKLFLCLAVLSQPCDQQEVSAGALFLWQVVSSIILITWPTVCEWHLFDSLSGSLINLNVSSHDQQRVSDTALFLYQVVSWIMSNREWVTLLYLSAKQSHESCLIPCPTESEWHCFISLPGSLTDYHVLSMTNSWWVILYFFAMLCCLIPCQLLNSMWVTLHNYLPGSLINHVSSHDQQSVSTLFLCQAVSSIMSHVTHDQQAVSSTALFLQPHQSCLIHDQQSVSSDTVLFIFQPVSSIGMSHLMTNRQWVTLHYFFSRQPH